MGSVLVLMPSVLSGEMSPVLMVWTVVGEMRPYVSPCAPLVLGC